jgi:hypothetical protein
MLVVGGLFLTFLSILVLVYATITKHTAMPLLLVLFFGYMVVGHAKTGITASWVTSDFSYTLANLLSVYLITKYKQINYLVLSCIVFTILSSVVYYQQPSVIADLDKMYKVISSILFVYVVSFLIIRLDGSYVQKIYSNFFVVFFFFALLLFLIQATLPYHGLDLQVKRHYVHAGGINILGLNLHRPTGISGTAHNAGIGLLIAYYFAYRYSINTIFNRIIHFGIYKYLFLFSSLFLAALSQRIFFIPLVLFAIYFLYKRSKLTFTIVLIPIAFVFMNIMIQSFQDKELIDRSNLLKIAIWYDVFLNNELTVKNALIGNGMGSSVSSQDLTNFDSLSQQFLVEQEVLDKDRMYSVHNIFIEMYYEMGFVFLAIYIIYFYKAISLNLQLMKRYDNISVEFLLLIAFLFNYMVHNGLYGAFFLFMILSANTFTPFGKFIRNDKIYQNA